jgi:hypothetical protein
MQKSLAQETLTVRRLSGTQTLAKPGDFLRIVDRIV